MYEIVDRLEKTFVSNQTFFMSSSWRKNRREYDKDYRKPNYPQPHSIKIDSGNSAYDEKMKEHLHHYHKKYERSKQSKRIP